MPRGVVVVVSSIPAVGHKIFSAYSGIVDLFYLSISIFIMNLYQFLLNIRKNSNTISVLFEQSFWGCLDSAVGRGDG